MQYTESHPSRVRGLKLEDISLAYYDVDVAPFTGAWIETIHTCLAILFIIVAPFTGAWIET